MGSHPVLQMVDPSRPAVKNREGNGIQSISSFPSAGWALNTHPHHFIKKLTPDPLSILYSLRFLENDSRRLISLPASTVASQGRAGHLRRFARFPYVFAFALLGYSGVPREGDSCTKDTCVRAATASSFGRRRYSVWIALKWKVDCCSLDPVA